MCEENKINLYEMKLLMGFLQHQLEELANKEGEKGDLGYYGPFK